MATPSAEDVLEAFDPLAVAWPTWRRQGAP